MSNRRNFLKFFGVGATIVPVVNGLPKVDAPASLLEIPKVEPVVLAQSIPMQNDFIASQSRPCEITVSLRSASGKVYHFSASTFVTQVGAKYPDMIHFRQNLASVTWTFSGISHGAPRGELALGGDWHSEGNRREE